MIQIIKKRKTIIILSLLISMAGISSLALTKSKFYKQIAESQKLINNVYKYLVTNYADDIDIEEFTRKSIGNMLSSLDPYTVYMEEEDREGLDILTHGKYGGVGMHLGRRDGKLTVIAPMDDSPAQRAGIISGDVIFKIDGNPTKDMNINDAAKQIRGKKGTNVALTIKRFDSDDQIEFSLVRSDIRVDDVTYSGMLDDKTGYIRLTRFSKNSIGEMKSALQELMTSNPESIILDLRGNPGGLLNAAIDILDMFVPKGEMLLTTKGRNKSSNRTLKASKKPIISEDINLAVLINEGSASASEIVSGTLQDLDRAIVVGETSFGKGLVQSVFDLDKSRSLKITTAKYYTPSGRLIQKPGYVDDEIIDNQTEGDTVFTTAAGRTVKGGGGITPDYEVISDKIGPLAQECYRKSAFFTFVQIHRNDYSSLEEALNDDKLMDSFASYLDELELDVKLKGEKQYELMKESFWSLDSLSTDLNAAIESLEGFISTKELALFDDEKDILELALHMEFAQTLEDSKKRTEIALKKDKIVQETQKLLMDQLAYKDLLSVQISEH
ncbi:MAG: S41 family peptidase [Candidatus Marinimicrobia bacterium]|nr:S41 family peptidase [Candidatus Neomarinimicrobiota bacterium]